jgi:protein-S-isoprenylcysteine O-methyltransferase Ste14
VNDRALLIITRWVLPLMIALVGGVLIAAGHANANSPAAAAGVGLIIVAIIVWMINWMFRLSVRSNEDRDREEEARRYFDHHGRWPDE